MTSFLVSYDWTVRHFAFGDGTRYISARDGFQNNWFTATWLEAHSRGTQTEGYTPSDCDWEQLERLRQERGHGEKQLAKPITNPAR